MNTVTMEEKDHVVIFPFMAKGHTIPLIHWATALSAAGLRVTFITTAANAPFLRCALPMHRYPDVHLIVLPFPHSPPLPSGCESTDTLPSFDLFPLFLGATALLRQPFDAVLSHLVLSDSPPLCLVSDFFFGWTLTICQRVLLPRVVFHGMSAFSMTLCKSLWANLPNLDIDSGCPFHVPGTPSSLLLTKSDIPDSVLKSMDPNDPGTQFMSELGETDLNSWGVLVNSFAELEGEYAALFESLYRNGARAWFVGPLCLLSDEPEESEDGCLRWLNEQEAGSVVYVSFGTQAHVPDEQLDEVAHGLAQSGCRYLWAVRSDTWAPPPALEEERGKIVKWAPQRQVLQHVAVGGFISHCGWNSVLEGVTAGVPILAWPMIAEQHLNAKLVVEELGAGIKLGEEMSGMVGRGEVSEGMRQLIMDGGESSKGVRARKKAAELGRRAKLAVGEGGSSQKSSAEMVEVLRRMRSQENGRSKGKS